MRFRAGRCCRKIKRAAAVLVVAMTGCGIEWREGNKQEEKNRDNYANFSSFHTCGTSSNVCGSARDLSERDPVSVSN